MSNNEIVYSIINDRPSLVVHADDADELQQMLGSITPGILADAQELTAAFLSTAHLGAAPIAPVAAGATPSSYAPAAPASNVVPLQAGGQGLPPRVNIYPGPDPKNPQYQMLYCEYPYISSQSDRERFTQEMKAATQNWWRWSPDHKAWLTKTINDSVVRAKFAEHAQLFA